MWIWTSSGSGISTLGGGTGGRALWQGSEDFDLFLFIAGNLNRLEDFLAESVADSEKFPSAARDFGASPAGTGCKPWPVGLYGSLSGISFKIS